MSLERRKNIRDCVALLPAIGVTMVDKLFHARGCRLVKPRCSFQPFMKLIACFTSRFSPPVAAFIIIREDPSNMVTVIPKAAARAPVNVQYQRVPNLICNTVIVGTAHTGFIRVIPVKRSSCRMLCRHDDASSDPEFAAIEHAHMNNP